MDSNTGQTFIEEMQPNFDALPERLKDEKFRNHLTNQQLSDVSGVPIATTSRILSGAVFEPRLFPYRRAVRRYGRVNGFRCRCSPKRRSGGNRPAPAGDSIQGRDNCREGRGDRPLTGQEPHYGGWCRGQR